MTVDADDTDPGVLNTRRRRLMLAAAATLAATAWAALLDEEAPAARSGPRIAAEPGTVSWPRAGATRTSAAVSALPTPAWPEPPGADRRQPWRAAPAPGVAAWSGPPALEHPPVTAPTAAAKTPPQAPAFPYTLIGSLDDGQPQALLSGPRRSFGVKAADVIDGEWRVDSVQARGLTLTWLPGGVKKTLALGPS
jgi:hypothetical protein